MAATEPELSVKLSLSSSTYSFSNPTPLVLTLSIESHSDQPITLFTWKTPFDPPSGMVQSCFTITDLASNEYVPQTTVRMQRAPMSRARGSHDEKYFLTLHPHTPTVVSSAFGRGGGMRSQPRAIVERGWVLDEQGNELKIRRRTKACGLDGLESGHRYKVNIARGALVGLWWKWGTKEEMLVEPGSLHWSFSELSPEQIPLEVGQIDGVEFRVEE